MSRSLLYRNLPKTLNLRVRKRNQSSCPSKVPFIKFHNGEKFPLFGLGTWKSKPKEVYEAVKYAIDIGYRHIDCAHAYENESEIGDALKEKIADGTVRRDELYITSKLWNTKHRPEDVEKALKNTLKMLCIDYIDLYLVHWPFAMKEGPVLFPFNPDGTVAFSHVDYLETWEAMEQTVKKCLAVSIGVSNFNKRQMERLLKKCIIKPVTNQIEVHPYLNQKELIKFLLSKEIAVTAYSPFGSPDRPWAKPSDPRLLDDPAIKVIAKCYNKSTAQVVLRYLIQRNLIVIPKSVTKSRIKENFEIWDFKLSSADMNVIELLNRNWRACNYQEAITHQDHPFARDEY